MSNFFDENILDEILSRIDIVELISSYLPLKRAGRNFKTTCPFHKEKTASFVISPDKQIYHCFGCSAGGNAFNFLMQYDRLEFTEAVRILAKKAGVLLPEKSTSGNKVQENLITQLYQINELASNFYQENLLSKESTIAKAYFQKRGIKFSTVKAFKLGFALDKWDNLIDYLKQKNINLSLIEKAGLIIPKENNQGFYDRFRNRIVFSISDAKSRVIGFGARVLDNSLPKYINSPETPIYVKGKNLFGLDLAKDAIKDEDLAIIVEGYFDCVIPYQEGVKNIVASSGTALTIEQIRLLKRYTHNVCLVYDPDTAGQLATLRSLDLFVEEDMDVRVVSLPEGFDPDLYVRKHGAEGFKNLVVSAENLYAYKMRILKNRFNSQKSEDKAKICSEMFSTINRIDNDILKSEYIKKLSLELHINEEVLWKEINKINKKVPVNINAKKNVLKQVNINPTEKLLINLMLGETEIIAQIKDKISSSDFQDERVAKIVEIVFSMFAQGKKPDANNILNHLGDEESFKLVCESSIISQISIEDKHKVVDDCVQRLKNAKVKQRKQFLQEQIKVAQTMCDEQKLNSLIEEFNILVKKG